MHKPLFIPFKIILLNTSTLKLPILYYFAIAKFYSVQPLRHFKINSYFPIVFNMTGRYDFHLVFRKVKK